MKSKVGLASISFMTSRAYSATPVSSFIPPVLTDMKTSCPSRSIALMSHPGLTSVGGECHVGETVRFQPVF